MLIGLHLPEETVGPRPQHIHSPTPPVVLNAPPDLSTTPNSSKLSIEVAPIPDSVPPGLSLPQDFPPLAAPSVPAPVLPPVQRKATKKNIKPVIPVVPNSSVRPTATQKESLVVEQAGPEAQITLSDAPIVPGVNRKTAFSKSQASETEQAPNAASPPQSSYFRKDPAVTTTSKSIEKKQRPGKLDIAAAKDSLKADSAEAESTAGEASSAAGFSQPPTPATAASPTSLSVRARQPRTIWVSREDLQQPASPSILGSANTSRQASPRPSLTSANRPDTPASEKISDNASFTTVSLSRASSPPPSKVGSAPVRQVTKSQQKKERQARAKLAETVAKIEEVPPKAEEVQAPILGRKKKTKKDKTQDTADSTPTVTRPTSPMLNEEAIEAKGILAPTPITPVKENKKTGPKAIPDVKEPDTPSSPATPAGIDQAKNALTAAAILAHLQRTNEVGASATDLFKPVPGLNHRFEAIEPNLPAADESVSGDQARLLEHGEPIHINNGRNDQVIYFPDRRCLRGLTTEQAKRYLELRKQALVNGDVPSHRALDGLIPPPPSVDAALVVSTAEGAMKNKKLENPFAAPIVGSELIASNLARNDSAILGGAVGGGIMQREATISVGEAEHTLQLSRRETEMLEKKLNAVLKRNRRILFGNVH